jgi:hypothetical protein
LQGGSTLSRHHSLAELKGALETYHGCVYLAAESLDVWPSAIYARIQKSPELQQLIDLYDGRRTDAAELKLEQAIREGEPWAIQFQLKTKGRDRGYVERREVDNRGKLTVEVEPKAGPELERAIRRAMGVLASTGTKSAIGKGDTLPSDFRAPH